MKLLEITIVWFFILTLYDVTALKFEESNQNDEEDSEPLPHQKELEDILGAFNGNDIKRMEEMFTHLKNQGADDLDEEYSSYSADSLKFVPSLIEAEGYPVEDHEVVTDDGYILHLYRLPHGRKMPRSNDTRPPVLIMHGLYDSSNCWIALGSDNSLGYLLADAGYDVWLANTRGTQPSRGHVRLSSTGFKQKAYWQFSWHEIGIFDLPAMIDHILSETNQKQLNYIGYSQGTTVFLVMASMREEYNKKIRDVHLIAPVASLDDQYNVVTSLIARFYEPVKKIAEMLRIYKIAGGSNFFLRVFSAICDKFDQLKPCKLKNSMMETQYMNRSVRWTDDNHNMIGGGSVRQGWHYLQMIRNGGFHEFDYEDKKTNVQIYGRETPPAYNLTKITAPVNLYFSKDDDLATIKNAIHLQRRLPNHKSSYLVPIDDFQHSDFSYSFYTRKLVNNKLIRNINKANGFV